MANPVVLMLLTAAGAFLFGPLLFWLLLGRALVLPLYFAMQSAVALMLVPQQLLGILVDRRLRKNHALEHATVNVLEEQLGPTEIAGMATRDGFLLMGRVPPPGPVLAAAQQALARMKRGESRLALHPRCGTSIAAANLVFALTFLYGLWATDLFALQWVLLALLAAHLSGRPLGMVLQRWVTTDAEVGNVELVDLSIGGRPLGLGMIPGAVPVYRFRTRAREPVPAWRSGLLADPRL